VSRSKGPDGDSVPERAHRRGWSDKQWVDLQLPLYRHILLQRENYSKFEGAIELGYILLSADSAGASHEFVAWSEEDFDEALEIAREIAGDVREERFWPPSDSSRAFDDFATICGARQFVDQAPAEEYD